MQGPNRHTQWYYPLWSNWRKQTIDVSPMYTSIAKPDSLHGPWVHGPQKYLFTSGPYGPYDMGAPLCCTHARPLGLAADSRLACAPGTPSTETGSVLLQPVSSPRWKASRRPSSLRWRTSWQSWISSSRSTRGGISMSRLLSGGQSTGR